MLHADTVNKKNIAPANPLWDGRRNGWASCRAAILEKKGSEEVFFLLKKEEEEEIDVLFVSSL